MTVEHVVIDRSDDPTLAAITAMLRGRSPAPTHADKRPLVEGPHTADPDQLRDEGFTVDEVDADGVPAWLATPPGSEPVGTLVGLHGGGFVVCSGRTHLRRFAIAGAGAGWRTLSVDYRLAPEHPFPAALDDAEAVLRWAARTFPGPLALIGDSAGGNLCLALLQRVRDGADQLPVVAAVVISPWADLRSDAPSFTTRRDRDPFAHLDDLDAYARMYAGDHDPGDPLLSPGRADFAGFPPLLVQVGSDETMYDDAVAVAAAADRDGVPVRFEEWTGMFHTWHTYAGELRGADAALGAISEYLRSHTSGPAAG